MPQIFDQILLAGMRAGQMPARSSTAREWYRNKAKEVRGMNETKIMKDASNNFQTRFKIGNLYMYYYDPKWKKELPYYDRFPIVFPITAPKDGKFTGINLHYLHPKFRAKLMDALYEVANNDRYDETTKVKISYKILDAAAKFRYFKPCVKTYLVDHVRSKLLYVHPVEWDIALFIPNLERFEKATKTQVWEDSAQMIRTGKAPSRKKDGGTMKGSTVGKSSRSKTGAVRVKPTGGGKKR